MRRSVAGKARVHELAKELGVTSKQVLTQLESLGEFVKSASSTAEAPVARKLRDSMNGGGQGRRLPRRRRPPAPPAPAVHPRPASGAPRPRRTGRTRGRGDPGPRRGRSGGRA